jgi:hypothetical protein
MPSVISSTLSFLLLLLPPLLLLLLLLNSELLSSSASICATNIRFFSVNPSKIFCLSAKSRAEFALKEEDERTSAYASAAKMMKGPPIYIEQREHEEEQEDKRDHLNAKNVMRRRLKRTPWSNNSPVSPKRL